jgi:hypothetical protein
MGWGIVILFDHFRFLFERFRFLNDINSRVHEDFALPGTANSSWSHQNGLSDALHGTGDEQKTFCLVKN